MFLKNNEFEYCQAEFGVGESTDSLANMRLEDSSVETQVIRLRESAGASKTSSDDLLEVQ
jgi:hypothetical protein